MIRTTLLAFSGLSVLLLNSFSGAVSFDGWDMQSGSNGQIVEKMVIHHPKTPLGIESEISINIDKFGAVTSGDVQFDGGVQRTMSQMEAATYWELFHGQHTLWDYMESQGGLTTLTTGVAVPNNWAGKYVRVTTLSGSELYGILISIGDSEQYSRIRVENASVGMINYMQNQVKKIQIFTKS